MSIINGKPQYTKGQRKADQTPKLATQEDLYNRTAIQTLSFELNAGNIKDLKTGNGNYGIELLPEVFGHVYQVIGQARIFHNGIPFFLLMTEGLTYIYTGWGKKWAEFSEAIYMGLPPFQNQVPVVEIAAIPAVLEGEFPITWTGDNGDGPKPGAVYLQKSAFDWAVLGPDINPDAKIVIEFEYILVKHPYLR